MGGVRKTGNTLLTHQAEELPTRADVDPSAAFAIDVRGDFEFDGIERRSDGKKTRWRTEKTGPTDGESGTNDEKAIAQEDLAEGAGLGPLVAEKPFALRDINLRIRHGWSVRCFVSLGC